MGLLPMPIVSMNAAAARLSLSILLAWSAAAWAQSAEGSQDSAPLALAAIQATEPTQATQAAQATPQYTQADLDQMLAPIALYPDELLAQILMAATYPLEVVQAARWSRSYPDLHGDEAVARADDEDWDPSVKALVAFPEVLALMTRSSTGRSASAKRSSASSPSPWTPCSACATPPTTRATCAPRKKRWCSSRAATSRSTRPRPTWSTCRTTIRAPSTDRGGIPTCRRCTGIRGPAMQWAP